LTPEYPEGPEDVKKRIKAFAQSLPPNEIFLCVTHQRPVKIIRELSNESEEVDYCGVATSQSF
jgi:hypothetical protein